MFYGSSTRFTIRLIPLLLALVGTLLLWSWWKLNFSIASLAHSSYPEPPTCYPPLPKERTETTTTVQPPLPSPSANFKFSAHPTLSIPERIYVLTLPTRPDRREHMERVSTAMGGLNFTYHDALPFSNPLVAEIINHVWYERRQAQSGADERDFQFSWAADTGTSAPLGKEGDEGYWSGADLWFLPDSHPLKSHLPADGPWYPQISPPQVVFGSNEFFSDQEWNVIAPPVVSCWYSHYQLLRRIAEGDEESVLVLEDDINMEWDTESRLRTMWPHVPPEWDVVFLGHCYSDGRNAPTLVGTPYLHIPSHIMCNHAFMISRTAARRLVRYLRSPLFAFSRPIDHIHNNQVIPGFLKLSVEPPIVVQVPKSEILSDIGTKEDQDTLQWLNEGALERAKKMADAKKHHKHTHSH